MSTHTRVACIAVAALLLHCGEPSRVLVVDSGQLLEKPYPLNYPSSKPLPNRVLSELADTRVCILGSRIGKDFQVFRVRTLQGLTGYLVGGPGLHEIEERCP